MDVREKLVELLVTADDYENSVCLGYPCKVCPYKGEDCTYKAKANHLIAHGVTVQGLDGCCRCKDTSEMTVAISNKLVAGVRTGWLGGNLPARYCPFCGRRLPQPPKGE